MQSADFQILPVGRSALLIEVADLRTARSAYRIIREMSETAERGGPLSEPSDVVPAARTVLIDGIPDVEAWRMALAGALQNLDPDAIEPETGGEIVVETRYDGPDLDAVAEAWGCSRDEVVRRHADASFSVAFCGFAPGFAYLTSDPALPTVPRRANPRPAVPAGSIGLADVYCGIYPRSMPGGWQLIGSTTLTLFDPIREVPALLRPGDTVRFERID